MSDPTAIADPERIKAVIAALNGCLTELDAMGLIQPSIGVDMAITALGGIPSSTFEQSWFGDMIEGSLGL